MDSLARLAGPAADLLDRADAALLAHGLPAGHPIAGLLRRLGALPADAYRAIAAHDPASVRAAASEVRKTMAAYRQQADLAARPADWSGPAGEQFSALQAALAGHLGDTMAAQLAATAGYLDEVADWMDESRRGMARAVADALGSAEAATLRLGRPHATELVPAAAAIGARVLAAAADALDAGQEIGLRWAGRLAEVSYSDSPRSRWAQATGIAGMEAS